MASGASITDLPLGPEQPGDATRPATPPPARRASRRTRRILVVLAALLLVGGGSVLVALALTRMTPRWWRDIDPTSPAVVDTAERVENGAATQLTRIRKLEPGAPASEPWTIKLSAADANAWLAARLRPWLESQEHASFTWPKDLDRVQVGFEDGRILIGASVVRRPTASDGAPQEARPQIVAASLRPELREGGGLWLPATSVSIGRLSVPPSWMLPHPKGGKTGPAPASPHAAPTPSAEALTKLPQMRDVIAALEGERPAMEFPIIRIGDGRRVKILELRPVGGDLYITCQTLPRETSRAGK